MENGRFIEQGTHNELLNRRGKYYKLWKDQLPEHAEISENAYEKTEKASPEDEMSLSSQVTVLFIVPFFNSGETEQTGNFDPASVNAEGASAVMETIMNTPVPRIPVYSESDMRSAGL